MSVLKVEKNKPSIIKKKTDSLIQGSNSQSEYL